MADEKRSGGGFGVGAVLVVLILLVSSTQCDGGGSNAPSVQRTTTTSLAMWGGKYDISVKNRIDSMAQRSDCSGLQAEFNQAYENDDITRRRTGAGTADLMEYIDGKLRSAGCY